MSRERFEATVVGLLNDLFAKEGMTLSIVRPDAVRWTSAHMWFEVRRNTQDGELASYFGVCDRPEELSFGLYLKSVDPELAQLGGDWVADSPDDVDRLLAVLQEAVQRHAAPILRGDPGAIDRARQLRWWHFVPNALRH